MLTILALAVAVAKNADTQYPNLTDRSFHALYLEVGKEADRPAYAWADLFLGKVYLSD